MSDQADSSPVVLVIDDEDIILDLFKNLLVQEGFRVLLAANAKEGINALDRHRPPVALVDKNLPDMSGLELIATQKQRHPGTEFIIITAYSTLQSAVDAMKLGAFSYIAKPFDDLDEILERINNAVAVAGKRKRPDD